MPGDGNKQIREFAGGAPKGAPAVSRLLGSDSDRVSPVASLAVPAALTAVHRSPSSRRNGRRRTSRRGLTSRRRRCRRRSSYHATLFHLPRPEVYLLRRSTCRAASSPAPASSPRGRRPRAALPAIRRRALALPRGRRRWEPRPEAMRRLGPLRRPKPAGGEAGTTWMTSWFIADAAPAARGPPKQQRRLRYRVHRGTLAHCGLCKEGGLDRRPSALPGLPDESGPEEIAEVRLQRQDVLLLLRRPQGDVRWRAGEVARAVGRGEGFRRERPPPHSRPTRSVPRAEGGIRLS